MRLGKVLLVLPLAACSLTEPVDTSPPAPPPAQWQTQPQRMDWPSQDWWRGFGSARLDQMMSLAAQSNLDIAQAAARVRQADAQARIAGAALLPSLSAQASLERQRQSNQSSSSSKTKAPMYTAGAATFSASYEIDFWGKNEAAEASALASAQASRFDHQSVILTAQGSVASTYFDVLSLSERLALTQATIANGEQVLTILKDRARVGTLSALDVAQQESTVAGLKASLPPLEQSLRQTVIALNLLLGRMPQTPLDQGERIADIRPIPVLGGLPAQLLLRRPDVLKAEAGLRAANADIAVARAAFFPSISLTGEAGLQASHVINILDHKAFLWSLGSSLSQSIFSGGKLEAAVDQKRARQDEVLDLYRQTVLAAFGDVENALIAVNGAQAKLAAQSLAEQTARTADDLAQAQLRAGIVDVTTVLNTQKTLFSAQDALAQARLDQLKSLVALYKALGGGWSSDPSAPSGTVK